MKIILSVPSELIILVTLSIKPFQSAHIKSSLYLSPHNNLNYTIITEFLAFHLFMLLAFYSLVVGT
jgi:hypothetical protein